MLIVPEADKLTVEARVAPQDIDQAEENRLMRQKGIDPALSIIERETTACCLQLRHQRDVDRWQRVERDAWIVHPLRA